MLAIASILVSRYPAIALNTELNPDEGQVLAQVMRISVGPVPWRGMDGTTTGPLNTWFVWLFHALRMPLAYTPVHVLAAVLLAFLAALVHRIVLRMAGARAALGAVASVGVTIVLAQGANFVHFSSELVPSVLVCCVVLCLVSQPHPQRKPWLDLTSAVIIGLLPWTKLQSLFSALALALWLLADVLHSPQSKTGGAEPGDRRRLAAVLAAMLLPSGIVLGVVIASGAWSDFWYSYVLGNLGYVRESSLGALAWKIVRILQAEPSRLLVGATGFAILWSASGKPGWSNSPPRVKNTTTWLAILTGASILSTFVPRDPFPHYHILWLGPLSALGGCLFSIWGNERSVGSRRAIGTAMFVLLMIGLPLTSLPEAARDARAATLLRKAGSIPTVRRIAGIIRRVAPGAGSLVVWGWTPGLHVETGMTPGTRHVVGHFVQDAGPSRSHLQGSFLQDVRAASPDVIVDAVATGCFTWRWDVASQRIDSFPALGEYVRQNYVLLASELLEGKGEPVRVYVSKTFLRARASARSR